MSGLVGGKAKAPTVLAPVVMPLEDTEATKKAKRKANTTATERGGRASTVLAGEGEKLGGG
jgi:hypothetical protein